ncbi:MAG: hypothetical protein LBT40_15160 [Deltaproteobacteria bacterium]|nr:hypothetical protein [Deltaproteobacteria bacterium]
MGQILTSSSPAASGATTGPSGERAPASAAREALASALTSWALATGVLCRELSPVAASVLAEPREGRNGTIEWHSPLSGPARELALLPGPERAAAVAAARQKAAELTGLGTRLSSSGDPSSRAAAGIISRVAATLAARASGVPGPETVWSVGGATVLAGWSARLPSAAPPSGPAPVAPVPLSAALPALPQAFPGALVPLPGTALSPPLALSAATPPPVPGAPAAGHAGEDGGQQGLRAALAAVVAFLLAVLLFFLLSPGFRGAATAIPADPLAGVDAGREEGLRLELADLQGRYRDRLRGCAPAEEARPDDESPPALPEPERLEEPPEAGEAPAALEAEAPPPPPPPEPEKPKAGSELEIPEDAKDLAFLEGCWKSDAGLINSLTRQPLFCIYCFQPDGKATVRVEELDRSGRLTQTCRATATARLQGGKLRIRDTGARCPNGRRYKPDTVLCSPSKDGAANCTLQSDGGKLARTRITRQ